MTSSSSAPDAPGPRWQHSWPEAAPPSYSSTRTDFRAIKSSRPTLSIRQASTFSTMSVLARQSARRHRRRASCGCVRTTLSWTSSFPDTELSTVLADGGWTVSCRMRQRRQAVEVRDQTRVTALVREEDRVVGVRAARSAGQEQMIRANLVVGADGRHSTVARQVEAEEYLGYDAPRAMFWGYWNAPAFWRSDPAYPFGMYVANTDGHIRVIFQTDHDQLLIGSLPPVERAMAWRTDPGSALIADLASDSTTGPLIAGSAPQERVRGTLKERYFFRRAAGNGWALVGDAGHHKEFVIGDGITEALLQARSLASAIAKGTDQALHRWWRARDVDALPYFFLGQDEGKLGPPLELQQIVFSHVAMDPTLRARMSATMEHQLSPQETFSVRQVLWWAVGAAIRGSPGVVRQFFAMGRRGAAINRELGLRRRLLAEADAAD